MTDQAAAEALVAVGRMPISSSGSGEEDVSSPPKKKRARKSKNEDPKAGGGENDDDDLAEGQQAKRSRGSDWGGSVSPERRTSGDSGYPGMQRHHSTFLSGGASPSMHHHGGLDLPPLNAALHSSAGAPSSYVRSGSQAPPSRTHSPLNPASYTSASGGPPTLAECERHYAELTEWRRRQEDQLERTNRMLDAMHKGIEEMRAMSAQQQAAQQPTGPSPFAPPGQAQMIPPGSSARQGGERSRESVWAVTHETPRS